MPAARAYWLFFVESLDDGLDDAPAPELLDGLDELLLESLDEPEPDEGAADGEDGVLGLVLLELEDGELGRDDGVDMLPDVLPELLPEAPVLPVPAEPPRSHAAIMLAPRATDTATARVESFILPP